MSSDTLQAAPQLNITSVGGQSEDTKVLFIHGFGADKQTWAGNVASVFEFAEALLVDLPGHGDALSIATGGSISSIADKLLSSLETEGSIHFVGHSVGASVAAVCAAKQPDKVASLTLLAPAGLGTGVSRDFIDRFVLLENESDALQLLQTLVHNERLIAPALASLLMNQLQLPGARESLQQFTDLLPGTVAEVTAAFREIKKYNIRRQIFWGRQDRINGASSADEKNIGGDWYRYDDTGHLLHVEQRVRFNRVLCEFLKG